MNATVSRTVSQIVTRRITVAEYLTTRDLPADWQYASPFGRVAAETFRSIYHREPGKAFRLINGRFRKVMAYRASELHVLDIAWRRYPRTGACQVWHGSSDAMQWTPSPAPLTRHP